MTGFARVRGDEGGQPWTWEVRSVNGRSLDLRLRLPPGLETLEAAARGMVAARLRRGSVTCILQMAASGQRISYRLNRELLEELTSMLTEVGDAVEAAPPRLDGLLGLKGVLEPVEREETEADRSTLEASLLEGLDRGLDELRLAREEEGGRLAGILDGLLNRIEELVGQAEAAAQARQGRQRERLLESVAQLLDAGAPVAEERLAQELALLAVKADVTEELDRLRAHVAQARGHLAADEPVGRQLDFLSQEFNREANTLCAKANDLELTRHGLDLKLAIDRFREQIQNVE